jgi:threonine synthase
MLDLQPFKIAFTKKDILQDEWNLFRYIKALPIEQSPDFWKPVSMGEGVTDVVKLNQDYPHLYAKMEYMMPTLSFKDRGAAVLIAKAKELGAKKIVQDSSGNGGNAIAAYAARAGIKCDIYVPEGTSDKKVRQIAAHGAQVYIIPGTREDTAAAALDAAQHSDAFYASHVYNPYFYQGTKTYAYELWEQFGEDIPLVVLPVGKRHVDSRLLLRLLRTVELRADPKASAHIGRSDPRLLPYIQGLL